MEESPHPSFFPYICMGKNHIRLISRMQRSDYLTGFARLINHPINLDWKLRFNEVSSPGRSTLDHGWTMFH